MSKATLQEYADDVLADEYKQPLKTLEVAIASIGWPYQDKPVCCGQEVEIRSMIGYCYHAECGVCGKFIHDMSGPSFKEGAACIYFLNSDRIEMDVAERWIAGSAPQDSAPPAERDRG